MGFGFITKIIESEVISIPRGSRYKYEDYHKLINNELYKLCANPDCSVGWQPCTDIYYYKNDKNKQDGLHPTCKICDRKRSLARRNIHRKENNEANRRLRQKPEFKQRERERLKKCRERGIQDAWRKMNPDKCKASALKHKEKEHIMWDEEWESTKQYFNHRCAYCGLPIEEHWITFRKKSILGDFHKEHVIHTGKNNIKNCIPSCQSCNSEKHDKSFYEWYNPNNPKFSKERYNKIYMWIRYDCLKYILPKRSYKGQRLSTRIEEINKIKSK